MMAKVRAERLRKIPAEPSPELRIPAAAAQTRVVSLAGIRLGSWESARAFKGIICVDISEFESSPEARAAYLNPIEQQMEIVQRIGPSLMPIVSDGWMTFTTPHPELPGFPTHTFDVMHKEHYYFKSATGRSTRECELTLQLQSIWAFEPPAGGLFR